MWREFRTHCQFFCLRFGGIGRASERRSVSSKVLLLSSGASIRPDRCGVCRRLTQVDDDGLSQPILRTHTITVPKELRKPQPTFKHRSPIPKRPFCGLPGIQPLACERNGSCPRSPLARCSAIAKIVGNPPVQKDCNDISPFMKVPVEVDVGLMQHKVPPGELQHEPDNQGHQQIDSESKHPLPERSQRQPVQ
jgi:hypothetical protein